MGPFGGAMAAAAVLLGAWLQSVVTGRLQGGQPVAEQLGSGIAGFLGMELSRGQGAVLDGGHEILTMGGPGGYWEPRASEFQQHCRISPGCGFRL